MADADHRRRESDDEAFKYQIVAEQARITTKVELLHDMVKLQLADHDKRLADLETAVIGGTAGPGLLEKNRNVAQDVAKLFAYIIGAGLVLWKVLSPIYDAWIGHRIPQMIAAADVAPPSSKLIRRPK